jgi:hypothetical protein
MCMCGLKWNLGDICVNDVLKFDQTLVYKYVELLPLFSFLQVIGFVYQIAAT